MMFNTRETQISNFLHKKRPIGNSLLLANRRNNFFSILFRVVVYHNRRERKKSIVDSASFIHTMWVEADLTERKSRKNVKIKKQIIVEAALLIIIAYILITNIKSYAFKSSATSKRTESII